MKSVVDYTLLDAQTSLSADFTASGADLTSVAHGLVDGDIVELTTTGTLPANLSTGTQYYVVDSLDDVFGLSATEDGTAITTGDAGTGTHTFHKIIFGRVVTAKDFQIINLTISTSDSAAATIKFQNSQNEDSPDFTLASSVSNPWDFVQIIDKEDDAAVDGDTGVTFSGTDDVRKFEVNSKVANFVTVKVINWTAGAITVKARCFNNY
jgi:hypothetical protein